MRSNLMTARKIRDKIGEKVFSNIVSKILVAEKSGKYSMPLTDEVVVSLIQKEVKELEETKSFYKEPCEQSKELDEQITLLSEYLPKQLTEQEVIELIYKLSEIASNKGKLVGMVCKEVGSRFDRSKVKPLVDRTLS